MASYKMVVCVFEEAEADYMTYNLPFRFLLWKIWRDCPVGTQG